MSATPISWPSHWRETGYGARAASPPRGAGAQITPETEEISVSRCGRLRSLPPSSIGISETIPKEERYSDVLPLTISPSPTPG